MKTILITGGSGKIGFQLVNHFLQHGFQVVTTTRNEKNFRKIREKDLPGEHIDNLKVIEVDFSFEDAEDKILNYLVKRNISVHHIVHNARCLDYLKLEDDTSVSKKNFLSEFFLDVVFPYQLSFKIFNSIKPLESIVFISSIYGVVAPTPSLYDNFHKSSPIHYGVSKSAQIHLVKELAVRFAPNVRVNCVSFGGIKGRASQEFVERYSLLNPQGKMIEEEEVTGPVEFLVSPQSRNMTGQNLIVDGGWTIW